MGNRLFRYGAAMMLLLYGFAKINGSQFTILDSELDKPMGQVSGFWLTWYYFGYSPIYGNFLALVQIAGAMLLTFRRTALLGACVLAPVLGNIVLIDILYGVELSATVVAIVLLCIMLGLISGRWADLRALFLPTYAATEPLRWKALTAWGIRFAMLATACGLTYWIANYNNRDPSPIDGTWDVVGVEPAELPGPIPATIFFEYNRANMAVFKFPDGAFQTHRFRAGPLEGDSAGSLQMWERWLGESAKIFEGQFRFENAGLRIEGMLGGKTAVFSLRRRAVR